MRKKSKTGICHVMQGKESKTCPSDSIMAAGYIKYMVTSNTTCTYATTSLSSPIVEKYNKITKDSIQPDDSESVYE